MFLELIELDSDTILRELFYFLDSIAIRIHWKGFWLKLIRLIIDMAIAILLLGIFKKESMPTHDSNYYISALSDLKKHGPIRTMILYLLALMYKNG